MSALARTKYPTASGANCTAYLLHFSEPFRHARHYLGITNGTEVRERIAAHQSGNGAILTRHAAREGVVFALARTWPNVPRFTEMRLKKRGGLSRLCPICAAMMQANK